MPPALLQIVPSLPPALNGVGDYATLLARELLAAHGIATHFLVADPAWQPSPACPFPATHVSPQSPPSPSRLPPPASRIPPRSAPLSSLIPHPSSLLLHYVGYGYARRGCPVWLVDALARWKRAEPAARLFALFHETYAGGDSSPWSSAFWTAPLQRSLVRRLSLLADGQRLTTQLAADELRAVLPRRARGRTPLEVVPVFSNLGELAAPAPLAVRRRTLVVFGSPGWRAEAYTRRLADLAAACRRLEIERVVDIGKPTGLALAGLLPVPVEEAGPLAAEEASALFAESCAGYFTYPVPFLAKSGIFAAYCAHGLLPVTFPANRAPNADGLRPSVHYLLDPEADPAPDPAAIAAAAHDWYQGHRLAVHAEGIARQIAK